MLNIGENLRNLRKEKRLSLRKLSAEVGISHNTLAVYERNKAIPSLENALKICNYYNVPLEYLFLGDKSKLTYNDFDLIELFHEVDKLNDEYRILIKKYIRKIIRHKKEKDSFIKESE